MKTIICGSREAKDIEDIEKAVKMSKFTITEVVCGDCRGADKLGKEWADKNKIPVKPFPAKWDDLNQDGAVIKERKNFKGKLEKYNSNAGFFRNGQMCDYAEQCIAIQRDGSTPGTQDMIKKMKKKGAKVYVYTGETEDYEFNFGTSESSINVELDV